MSESDKKTTLTESEKNSALLGSLLVAVVVGVWFWGWVTGEWERQRVAKEKQDRAAIRTYPLTREEREFEDRLQEMMEAQGRAEDEYWRDAPVGQTRGGDTY